MTITLRAKPGPGIDPKPFTVHLTADAPDYYYGRPEGNPACPLIVWPKFAWEALTREQHCTHPAQTWCDCDWCRYMRQAR